MPNYIDSKKPIDVFVGWIQTCQKILYVQASLFRAKIDLNVSNQFNGSISKSAENLEEFGRGQIFAFQAR